MCGCGGGFARGNIPTTKVRSIDKQHSSLGFMLFHLINLVCVNNGLLSRMFHGARTMGDMYSFFLLTNACRAHTAQQSMAFVMWLNQFLPLFDTETINLLLLSRYEIGVGYSSGNDDIVRYQTFEPTPLFGATALHTLTPLAFAQVGLRAVYFNIKSYNPERLHSVISSNPVFIKSDANIRPSWLFDGRDPSSGSDFQIATTEISGWFHIGMPVGIG